MPRQARAPRQPSPTPPPPIPALATDEEAPTLGVHLEPLVPPLSLTVDSPYLRDTSASEEALTPPPPGDEPRPALRAIYKDRVFTTTIPGTFGTIECRRTTGTEENEERCWSIWRFPDLGEVAANGRTRILLGQFSRTNRAANFRLISAVSVPQSEETGNPFVEDPQRSIGEIAQLIHSIPLRTKSVAEAFKKALYLIYSDIIAEPANASATATRSAPE